MILAALSLAGALGATPPPGIELMRDLPMAPGAVEPRAGLEKDLWISPRLLWNPAHDAPALDKDLRIAPPGTPGSPALLLVQSKLPPQAERTPNLYKLPERCKDAPVKVVDRHGRPVATKLADLPKGALIYAVDRREDGCPVLMVAYGTPALDNPNPPPAEPLRSGVIPPKPEDAPSNRR